MASGKVQHVVASHRNTEINDNKCNKCTKTIKTGIFCSQCTKVYHIRCARIDPVIKDNEELLADWTCDLCSLSHARNGFTDRDEEQQRLIENLMAENRTLKEIIECLKRDMKALENRVSSNIMGCRPAIDTNVNAGNVERFTTSERWRRPKRSAFSKDHRNENGIIPLSNRFTPLQIMEEPNLKQNQVVTTQKYQLPKRKYDGRIQLYADSHGRGLATRLKTPKHDKIGVVKPGAPSDIVLRDVASNCESLGSEDCVVLMCGTNDIARNESSKVVENLDSVLMQLKKTNVVVVNVPVRHDLGPWSIINTEVKMVNQKLHTLSEKYPNVELIDVSVLDRDFHTNHGMHLNGRGKDYLAEQISLSVTDKAHRKPKN